MSAGTQFPTALDHWKRQLVPTCPRGVPERLFKLIVCELGSAAGAPARLGWDAAGTVHPLGLSRSGGDSAYVVKLNESSPTLGFLDPPHDPVDRDPRLELAFGVDEDRWLVATVRDLKTGKLLLDAAPVVKVV